MSTWVRWRRWVVARNLAALATFVSETALAAGDASSESGHPTTLLADDARYVDAHSDHVLLFPTAETHPKGTLYYTGYEILVPHIGYAVTHRSQLSLTWLGDHIDMSIKVNVHRGPWLRFAALGAFDFPLNFPYVRQKGRLGAVGQLCASRVCWTSLSINGWLAYDPNEGYPAHDRVSTLVSAGGILALGRVVKLLVEPILLWDHLDTYNPSPEFGLGAGVRISGEQVGIDLGFVPIEVYDSTPIPWIAFTFRTSGHRPGE